MEGHEFNPPVVPARMPQASAVRLGAVTLCTVLASGLLAQVSPFAHAHAIVVKSTPAANSTVPAGTLEVAIAFNTRLDRARSRLVLADPAGEAAPVPLRRDSGATSIHGRADLANPGRWKLRWQVLAADGHITRGEIPFNVATPQR
jgi:methionine-rich copper-binding protein CopC